MIQKITHFLSTLVALVPKRGNHKPNLDTKQRVIIIQGDNNYVIFKDNDDHQ